MAIVISIQRKQIKVSNQPNLSVNQMHSSWRTLVALSLPTAGSEQLEGAGAGPAITFHPVRGGRGQLDCWPYRTWWCLVVGCIYCARAVSGIVGEWCVNANTCVYVCVYGEAHVGESLG